MKNILIVSLIIITSITGIYCYALHNNAEVKEKIMTDKKILIAYYSYSGHTKAVAEKIQKITGGDVFEIVPKNAYPTKYSEVVEQAKKEKNENIMPELKENTDISKYDVIFLGTPVWWYTATPVLKSFVEKNNFKGKVIAPFCTHGGGGESATYTDIQKLAPDAKFLKGFSTYEKAATEKDVADWIKSLDL